MTKKKEPAMTTGLRIAAGVLGFAAEFISKEKTRYYLNGVYIEPAGTGVVAVATDGHRLIAVHDEHGFIERPAIIRAKPSDLVRFRSKHDATLSADAIGERITSKPILATLRPPKGNIEDVLLDEIDGTFPEWRKVVPVDFPKTGVIPAFQARYLAAFDGLARVGGRSGGVIVVSRGPAEPAVVTPASSGAWPWIGIVMPILADDAPTAYPAWLGLAQKKIRVKASAQARAA